MEGFLPKTTADHRGISALMCGAEGSNLRCLGSSRGGLGPVSRAHNAEDVGASLVSLTFNVTVWGFKPATFQSQARQPNAKSTRLNLNRVVCCIFISNSNNKLGYWQNM